MKSVALTSVIVLALAAPAAAAAPELPVPVQEYQGVKYYSGGVGIEERAQLPQRYSLKLVFATDKGNLLCNAEVRITAGGKAVFEGRAENGPWLMVDLPAGTYDITAVQDGTRKTASRVTLAARKQRTVLLRWKTTEVDMGL